MQNSLKLGIVIPCFNEEPVINETTKRLVALLTQLIDQDCIRPNSFIFYVDDGSSDQTWSLIEKLSHTTSFVKGLKLSRNFGHQNALLAGLTSVKSSVDCAISLDADLQDDISVIPRFIEALRNGADIVYGIRHQRDTDSIFKKHSALIFYKIMRIMGAGIIINHADYRLCTRRVLEQLTAFKEVNLFLRGIFPYMGFKTAYIYYERNMRFAGETKYPIRKMLSFAFEGISSFSTAPLRLVTFLGFFIFAASIIIMSCYLLQNLFIGGTIPGWTSTVLPIYFIGGVQLFCLGLVGEYIGKIYNEVKQRPRFIKDKEIL